MKVFVEKQRFSPLIFAGLLVSFLVVTSIAFKNTGSLANEEITSLLGKFSGSIIVLLIAVLFVFLKLKTRVDEQGIHYQFLPIHFSEKSILWNEIEKCYVRKYNPITEYGGWGIRGLGSKNKAYNTQGNIGLQLVLKNGKKLLFGTQMKTEMEQVVKTYNQKRTQTNERI